MSSRIIQLPPTTTPNSNGNPVNVLADYVATAHYDGTNANIFISGAANAYQIAATDSIDGNAIVTQVLQATQNANADTVITGNPTIPGQPAGFMLDSSIGITGYMGYDYGVSYLIWTAGTGRAASYNILRSSDGGTTFSVVGNTLALNYTDGTLQTGVTYEYQVQPVSARGFGPVSSNLTGVTTPLPGTPTAGISAGYNQITVSWGAITPAANSQFTTSYKIYRGSVGGPYDPIAYGVFATSYDDIGLIPGQYYEYVVTAVINGIEGAQSNAVNTTPNALAAPAVTITSEVYSIGLSWPAVTGSEGYYIYRSTVSGSETLLYALQAGVTTFTDTGLDWNQTYYYKVTAVAGGLEGPQSTEASAQPQHATFASATPGSVSGGVMTFTGSGFDPSQAGQMLFGTVSQVYLPVTYVDANTIQITTPGGLTPGQIQFFYVVGGGNYQLPFTVAFS